MTTELVTGVLAFLGAGLGSGLAFWATRSSTAQDKRQGALEEWGRRFTAALEALTSDDARRREIGRRLLVQLLSSSLATEDDRATAAALLDASAIYVGTPAGDLRAVVEPGELDDTRVVEDDESDPEEGEPNE